MIKKVLIAEDHEAINFSIQKVMEQLSIAEVEHVHYCDDALTKITIAMKAGKSYDLLITDLYFDEDYRKQALSNGQALINAVRQVQADLKILVFSSEHKPEIIRQLFDKLNIDGFVMKSRHDVTELKKAMTTITTNQRHIPMNVLQLINKKKAYEFQPYDIFLIRLIAEGVAIIDIPEHLEKKNIHPYSKSSVEKKLKQMRDALEFSKNEQLILYCKEYGYLD